MRQWLGIPPSYSRPHVSDDNAFAESLFRTAKYRPEFPIRGFADLQVVRAWGAAFVRWYNTDHRHSGIRYVSPAQRHAGHPARASRALPAGAGGSSCALEPADAKFDTHRGGHAQSRARGHRADGNRRPAGKPANFMTQATTSLTPTAGVQEKYRKTPKQLLGRPKQSGGNRIRTGDLLHAMQTRYQLRHTPKFDCIKPDVVYKPYSISPLPRPQGRLALRCGNLAGRETDHPSEPSAADVRRCR